MERERRQNEHATRNVYLLPQGVLTNNLAQALAYRPHWSEEGRHYEGKKLEVLTDHISDGLLRKLGVGTIRILDWLLIHRSKVNREITLSMDEYLQVANRHDRASTYDHFKDQLNLLGLMRINATDDTHRKALKSERLTLLDEFKVSKGIITVTLSEVFYELTKSYPCACIDPRLFLLDWKNKAHAYLLGRQLFIHQRLRKRQGTTPVIDTQLLLEKCGFSFRHDYERKRVERIQKPFNRDMTALAQVTGLNWSYDTNPRTFDEFLESKIRIQEEAHHVIREPESRDDNSAVLPPGGCDLVFSRPLLVAQLGGSNEAAYVGTMGCRRSGRGGTAGQDEGGTPGQDNGGTPGQDEGGTAGQDEVRMKGVPRVGTMGVPRVRMKGVPRVRTKGVPWIRMKGVLRVRMKGVPRIGTMGVPRVRIKGVSRVRMKGVSRVAKWGTTGRKRGYRGSQKGVSRVCKPLQHVDNKQEKSTHKGR